MGERYEEPPTQGRRVVALLLALLLLGGASILPVACMLDFVEHMHATKEPPK